MFSLNIKNVIWCTSYQNTWHVETSLGSDQARHIMFWPKHKVL